MLKTILKKQRGASAILEAAFVYPLVIMVLAAMIYLAMYLLQASMLYMRAEQVATIAARSIAYPGYEKLGPNLEGNDYESLPGQSAIAGALEDYQLFRDAYRYWRFGNKLLKEDVRSVLIEQFEAAVASTCFLQTEVSCQITPKNLIVAQYVVVTITGKPAYPRFLDYLGIGAVLNYNISLRKVVPDTSEFIRNTDIVIDFTDYLLEKLHLNGAFSAYFSKIKTFVTDLTH